MYKLYHTNGVNLIYHLLLANKLLAKAMFELNNKNKRQL